MNFLAHTFLSGSDNEIKIGNFIADAVKGNSYNNYPTKIAKGILLHRKIDYFADTHKIYFISKKLLSEKYGLYSGIVIDIFFDHFLAVNWKNFSNINFKAYCRNFYLQLVINSNILPLKYKYMLPFLIVGDWFGSYKSTENIESVLKRMSKRTTLPDESLFAKKVLENNYATLEKYFFDFMNEIIKELKIND